MREQLAQFEQTAGFAAIASYRLWGGILLFLLIWLLINTSISAYKLRTKGRFDDVDVTLAIARGLVILLLIIWLVANFV